jgi:hypothetical protein
MWMIMKENSNNIVSLCQAIDAGDYTVVQILADALDDEGDSRANGLRLIWSGASIPYEGNLPGSTQYEGGCIKVYGNFAPPGWGRVYPQSGKDCYKPFRQGIILNRWFMLRGEMRASLHSAGCGSQEPGVPLAQEQRWSAGSLCRILRIGDSSVVSRWEIVLSSSNAYLFLAEKVINAV